MQGPCDLLRQACLGKAMIRRLITNSTLPRTTDLKYIYVLRKWKTLFSVGFVLYFSFFTIFVALFSPQFLYSSNFECSFSYFFLICSQQVNCLTQALTRYSQLYYLRNKLKLKRFKKIWISKGVSSQNAWQPARLKRRSWKRNKLRWRKN